MPRVRATPFFRFRSPCFRGRRQMSGAPRGATRLPGDLPPRRLQLVVRAPPVIVVHHHEATGNHGPYSLLPEGPATDSCRRALRAHRRTRRRSFAAPACPGRSAPRRVCCGRRLAWVWPRRCHCARLRAPVAPTLPSSGLASRFACRHVACRQGRSTQVFEAGEPRRRPRLVASRRLSGPGG